MRLLRHRKGPLILVGAQAASSAGNIALAIFVARDATIYAFAAFALAMPVYLVVQRISRVYFLIPRQIEAHAPDATEPSVVPANGCLMLGVLAAVATGVVQITLAGAAREWFGLIAIALPGLLLYDCVRNEAILSERLGIALRMDLGWLALQILGSLAVTTFRESKSWWHLMCWALPPLIIGAGTWARGGMNINFSLLQGWRDIWSRRGIVGDATTDVMSNVLVVQALPYAVAAAGSLSAVAGLRAGQTLLGPVNVIVLGVVPLLQMSVARKARNPGSSVSVVHRAVVEMTIVCAVYAVVLTLIPDALGVRLFGATWGVASPMLLALGFHVVGRTPFTLVTSAMRSLGMRRALVVQRLVSGAVLVGAATGAAAFADDIAMIPWAMATASASSSLALYVSFRLRVSTGAVASTSAIHP